jgi:hypothetical protein
MSATAWTMSAAVSAMSAAWPPAAAFLPLSHILTLKPLFESMTQALREE